MYVEAAMGPRIEILCTTTMATVKEHTGSPDMPHGTDCPYPIQIFGPF